MWDPPPERWGMTYSRPRDDYRKLSHRSGANRDIRTISPALYGESPVALRKPRFLTSVRQLQRRGEVVLFSKPDTLCEDGPRTFTVASGYRLWVTVMSGLGRCHNTPHSGNGRGDDTCRDNRESQTVRATRQTQPSFLWAATTMPVSTIKTNSFPPIKCPTVESRRAGSDRSTRRSA